MSRQLVLQLVHLLLQCWLDSFACWLGVVARHLLCLRYVLFLATGCPAHKQDGLRVVDIPRGTLLFQIALQVCSFIFLCEIFRSETGAHLATTLLNIHLVLPVLRRARRREQLLLLVHLRGLQQARDRWMRMLWRMNGRRVGHLSVRGLRHVAARRRADLLPADCYRYFMLLCCITLI